MAISTSVLINQYVTHIPKQSSEMFYREVFIKDRETPVSESLFNRVAVLIPTNLLKERLRQIDFSVHFGQFLKRLFIEHLLVAASPPCKDLVILQILPNYNPCFFVILPLLSLRLCNPSPVILASL